MRFEIRDTGIGIPAGDIDRIFERQHRVEGHRATYAGTGLGLSIVKELVEAMSGTLGVKSVDGQESYGIRREWSTKFEMRSPR